MAIVKAKPTSAGRRFVVKVVNPDLHKGKPHAALLDKKSKKGGRNNNGRITVRHIGGGHRQHYRLVDFKRNKMVFRQLLNAWNTILIAVQTSLWFFIPMVSDVTSLHLKA